MIKSCRNGLEDFAGRLPLFTDSGYALPTVEESQLFNQM